MSLSIRSFTLLSAFAAATTVLAQTSIIPLTDRTYPSPTDLPYKVDPIASGRGPQSGYSQCNSTTFGPDSQCQTAYVNSLDDFCVWAPPDANSTIADEEAATVAWCTKDTHGTRQIPPNSLTGVQYLRAPSYQMVVGLINQQNINIQSTDDGGEMDPHGADLRGNPLGGTVWSNGFTDYGNDNATVHQIIEWTDFMGSGVFCMKICNPANTTEVQLAKCNNIFDETGCNFVSPAAYTEGVFEVCDSDDMDDVGVYTGSNGVVSTYSQPAVVVTLPSVRTPSSSNCQTYASTDLYGLAGGVTTSSGTSATSTGTGSLATTTTSKATGSGTTSKATSTSGTTKSTSSSTGAAMRRAQGPEVAGMGVMPVMAIAAGFLAGIGAVVAGM